MALTDNFSGKVGLGWVISGLELQSETGQQELLRNSQFLLFPALDFIPCCQVLMWNKNCFFPWAGQQLNNAQAGCVNPGFW